MTIKIIDPREEWGEWVYDELPSLGLYIQVEGRVFQGLDVGFAYVMRDIGGCVLEGIVTRVGDDDDMSFGLHNIPDDIDIFWDRWRPRRPQQYQGEFTMRRRNVKVDV